MSAFYNEIDPYAAQWLRKLIDAGHIAAGVVEERSIVDLNPDELRGYTQCHFFAGIGVWSHALRLAGWPDDRPVWTGSCPCQPFSAAGKGKGHEDERHLWPTWQRLIRECAPPTVFGEQVAGAAGLGWLDVVLTDLESDSYAVAAADLCAAGVGAPHIRQRLFFVAHAGQEQRGRRAHEREPRSEDAAERIEAAIHDQRRGGVGVMAHAGRERGQPDGLDLGSEARSVEGEAQQRERLRPDAGAGGLAGLMADPEVRRLGQGSADASRDDERARPQGSGLRLADDGRLFVGDTSDARLEGRRDGPAAEGGRDGAIRSTAAPGEPRELGDAGEGRLATGQRTAAERLRPGPAAAGFWGACDWLPCRDGKARPVEPGAFPLAHGATARVGRLRAYGNAIVAPCAAEFIRAAEVSIA